MYALLHSSCTLYVNNMICINLHQIHVCENTPPKQTCLSKSKRLNRSCYAEDRSRYHFTCCIDPDKFRNLHAFTCFGRDWPRKTRPPFSVSLSATIQYRVSQPLFDFSYRRVPYHGLATLSSDYSLSYIPTAFQNLSFSKWSLLSAPLPSPSLHGMSSNRSNEADVDSRHRGGRHRWTRSEENSRHLFLAIHPGKGAVHRSRT